MQIFDKLCKIISEQMGLSSDFKFSRETTWQELNADSLDLVEIVMSVEDAFDVEISDETISHLENLGDLVSYLEKEQ